MKYSNYQNNGCGERERMKKKSQKLRCKNLLIEYMNCATTKQFTYPKNHTGANNWISLLYLRSRKISNTLNYLTLNKFDSILFFTPHTREMTASIRKLHFQRSRRETQSKYSQKKKNKINNFTNYCIEKKCSKSSICCENHLPIRFLYVKRRENWCDCFEETHETQ